MSQPSISQIATLQCLQIPLVWDQHLPRSQQDHLRAQQKYTSQIATYEKEAQTAKEKNVKFTKKPPVPPEPRMEEEESSLFLTLANAMQLLLPRSVSESEVESGRQSLRSYLLNYRKVCDTFSRYPQCLPLSSFTEWTA